MLILILLIITPLVILCGIIFVGRATIGNRLSAKGNICFIKYGAKKCHGVIVTIDGPLEYKSLRGQHGKFGNLPL